MKYETIKFNVGDEQFDVIHCLGDGQCECKSCKDKGKYNVSWTSWFYKLNENDKHVLCCNCLAEILIQNRIDKAIKDKIEQGTLIELPCKVGDTCYLVYEGLGDMCRVVYKIKKVKIDNIHYIGDNEFFTEIGEYSHYVVKFGEEIFTTREGAERRLMELQEWKAIEKRK